MKKNYMALTAGAALAMMIVTGCSGQVSQTATTEAQTQEESTAVKESQTSAESSQEATEPETEDAEEETMDEAQGGVADLYVPVKIWGTITEVSDRAIYVDNQSENSSKGEIILTIDPETTRILDGQNGFPVDFEEVEIGNFQAYLGPAMTMSLPPQAMPYVVIVNVPEDGMGVAQYVVAAKEVEEKDGEKILTGNDGTEYVLGEEVSIAPFLTKQIVQLEDIGENSECLIWLNQEEKVERIVLFP